jgi:hypothetical protein
MHGQYLFKDLSTFVGRGDEEEVEEGLSAAPFKQREYKETLIIV